MANKRNKLVWNVFVKNSTSKKIDVWNIFNYGDLQTQFKRIKKTSKSKEEFLNEISNRLRYLFWAKYEWEVTIHDWPVHDDFEYSKVDVYSQIEMNWPAFSEYIWNNL